MAKSPIEKALEKQQKEIEKQRREEQQSARKAQLCILEQYDGNDNNYINFDVDNLPRYLQDSFSLECEKLQMYGMLSCATVYMGGAMITLSESGKSYFSSRTFPSI